MLTDSLVPFSYERGGGWGGVWTVVGFASRDGVRMNSEKTPQPQTANGDSDRVRRAPSAMQQWFPGGVWLRNSSTRSATPSTRRPQSRPTPVRRRYQWGKYTAVDLIAAVSVATLLIPESMG
jgi:hypothetical protein